MLEIKNLSKRYKNSNYYSVKDLNITINDGEIFGFLGKNGAGKSTTIKCLTGILPFTEGSIKVCGYDIMKDPIKAKLNIGYVPDNHAVYENLTGKEYVNYMGNIYRVPKDKIKARLEEFSSLFNMTGAIDRQIRSYSHGMKQKICIIAALIHNPKFWVLDEPLMGLDPQSAAEIKGYMLEHKLKAHEIDVSVVDKFFMELFNQKTSMSEEDLQKALDPKLNCYSKKYMGGPAPQEVQRQLDLLQKQLDEDIQVTSDRKAKLAAAKDKLEAIAQVLPGIKSPTIIPLADPAWCSIHTVLDEKRFWEIINRLKAAGAEGILVLDIKKMVM